MIIPSGRLVRSRAALAAVPLLAVIAAWATGHVLSLMQWTHHEGAGLGIMVAYAVTFTLFAWQACLFLLDRPARVTPRQQSHLDALRVLVAVPTYSEPLSAVASTVTALLQQTRLPQVIYVVDDGSDVDYQPLLPWFMQACRDAGVVGRWQRQDNSGKRHAQGTALRETVDTEHIDVVWTVDSDARPDARCLEEGLKPLADPEVNSVASIILTENVRGSWLARVMDLVMLTSQLTDRAAMSAAGVVLVNSGASAFYRASVILEHLEVYLNETFFGRKVKISDDSMLTLFAAISGRTVQQPTSLVFTTMPERFRGHWKQNLRWNRGAFIRSWWRMKYLPMGRFAYWWHLSRWLAFAINTTTLVYVFAVSPLVTPVSGHSYLELVAWGVAVQVCFGATTALRYFAVARSDMSRAYQFGTWLHAPLAVAWCATVLRLNRWWAILTCVNMGWQTRPEAEPKEHAPGWLPADNSQTAILHLPELASTGRHTH